MSIKLMCVVCERGTENFSVVQHMDASGNILKRRCLCANCRGKRTLFCAVHQVPHVVCIDNTDFCTDCARQRALAQYNLHRAECLVAMEQVKRLVPRADYREFLKLIREPGGKKTSAALCLVAGEEAFALRYRVRQVRFQTVHRYLLRNIKKMPSLVALLLPSSDPKKRFHPKP